MKKEYRITANDLIVILLTSLFIILCIVCYYNAEFNTLTCTDTNKYHTHYNNCYGNFGWEIGFIICSCIGGIGILIFIINFLIDFSDSGWTMTIKNPFYKIPWGPGHPTYDSRDFQEYLKERNK